MEVVNALCTMRPIVDDKPASFGEALHASNFSSHIHEVPKKQLVLRGGLGKLGETRAFLWNDQDMSGRLWRDITESERFFILRERKIRTPQKRQTKRSRISQYFYLT